MQSFYEWHVLAITFDRLLGLVPCQAAKARHDHCNVEQVRELSADQKAQLTQQAQKYESQLASNAADLEALEGAGVSYAQLGNFKRAEALLSKLTNGRPKDAEAWRLLVQ